MRGVLAWLVEQACRPADATICEIANVTDEPEDLLVESGDGLHAGV